MKIDKRQLILSLVLLSSVIFPITNGFAVRSADVYYSTTSYSATSLIPTTITTLSASYTTTGYYITSQTVGGSVCSSKPCTFAIYPLFLSAGQVMDFELLILYLAPTPNAQYKFTIGTFKPERTVWQKTTTGYDLDLKDTVVIDVAANGLVITAEVPDPSQLSGFAIKLSLGTGTKMTTATTVSSYYWATEYFTYSSSSLTPTETVQTSHTTSQSSVFTSEQPHSPMSQSGLLAIVLVVAVLVVLALVMLRRRQPPVGRPPRTTAAKAFCINCGAELPAGSKFCNKCGVTQT